MTLFERNRELLFFHIVIFVEEVRIRVGLCPMLLSQYNIIERNSDESAAVHVSDPELRLSRSST